MKDFIPLVRQDRLREMNEYKSRGYIFREHEPWYRYVRNVSISNISEAVDSDAGNPRRQYFFQVRVEQSETRFFMLQDNPIKSENCIYLTIFDIYELLLDFSSTISVNEIVSYLKSKRDQKWVLLYTGLEFEVDFFSNLHAEHKDAFSTSSIKISFENLLLLISLIQDKSNYHWSNSKQENSKEYFDGIFRLLGCLISTSGHEILQNNGWKYDNTSKKYMVPTIDNDKKYYLTAAQYKNIMGV